MRPTKPTMPATAMLAAAASTATPDSPNRTFSMDMPSDFAVCSPNNRTLHCLAATTASRMATTDHGSTMRTCSQSVPVSDPVVQAMADWTTPMSSAKKNSAVWRLLNTVPTMTPASTSRTGEVPFFQAMTYTRRKAPAPPTAATSGRNAARPPKTTSTSSIIRPAPEETPRMNGLASSFRVTAWKMAPETARFMPTMAATMTRGRRMFQTMRLSRLISGSSPPRRNAFQARQSNSTSGFSTAAHASESVIE
jgi:hypothetical protein